MHYSFVPAFLLLASTFVSDVNAKVEPRQISLPVPVPVPSPTVPVPAKYQLQTKVIADIDDFGTNKSDLFVISYHIGAGLGVAALQKTPSTMYGYLNGTRQLFNYPGGIGPWPMVAFNTPYREFNDVSISIASTLADGGFYVNETGLQLRGSNGWLACDWWYANPQLFALNGVGRVQLPKVCSKVNLMLIAM